jgi:hypothetical protein
MRLSLARESRMTLKCNDLSMTILPFSLSSESSRKKKRAQLKQSHVFIMTSRMPADQLPKLVP